MKILFATMQFGRGYAQGTERYVTRLAEALEARGHEARVLAGDPEGRGPSAKAGAGVDGEPRLLALPTGGPMTVRGIDPGELIGVLKRERPDVVHLANPGHVGVGIAEAAATLKIPLVVTTMDYWWLCPKHTLCHHTGGVCDGRVTWNECLTCIASDHHRRVARGVSRVPVLRSVLLGPLFFGRWVLGGMSPAEVFRWMRRQEISTATLNAAEAVIFPSQTARSLIGPRLEHGRTFSIPYGLEAHWFTRGEERDRPAPASPTEAVIGFAGALDRHKGAHLLLEAVRRLGWTATRVRIAGGGTDEAYLSELRNRAEGLSVEFRGRVPAEQMPEFLSDLDALVVPSLWPENLPIVVLEAQACGTAVLASRVGGIAEMIPQRRHLFEPGSVDGLAACLRGWIENPASAAPVNVLTAEEMAERTIAVYETVRGRDQVPGGTKSGPYLRRA